MTTVIVCGGRTFANAVTLDQVLSKLVPAGAKVVDGAQTGADTLAHEWAVAHEHPTQRYPFGDSGPVRNMRMLEQENPAFVVAFPGGRGTGNMRRLAWTHGVPMFNVATHPDGTFEVYGHGAVVVLTGKGAPWANPAGAL